MVLSAWSTISPDTIGPFKSALLRLRLRLLPHPRDPTTTPAPLRLRPTAGSRLTWGQNRTESVAADFPVASVVVAVRYPAVPRIVVPTATAYRAGRARTGPSRVSLCSLCIPIIPIPSPLPHIPRHIIQPIPINSIGSNRCRSVFFTFIIIRQRRAYLIRSPGIVLP